MRIHSYTVHTRMHGHVQSATEIAVPAHFHYQLFIPIINYHQASSATYFTAHNRIVTVIENK